MRRDKPRAGAIRRLVFATLAAILVAGVAHAKIVEQQDAPPKITPGSQGNAHVDYYMFGTLPGWYNQGGLKTPPRVQNLSLGTVALTRSVIHDNIALRAATNAERRALDGNTKRAWQARRFRGLVTPTNTFRDHGGLLCRSYQHAVTLDDGVERTLLGNACRASDGEWVLVTDAGK